MPTPAPSVQGPSKEFLEVFRAQAGSSGVLPFDRFMGIALYDASVGYYCARRKRVGYAGADFFTASTSGPLFGELVTAACRTLLHGDAPADYTFVEIGAEPGGGVLQGVTHAFGAARTVRVGEPLALQGRCIVFSNELFDAQPFRRFVFDHGAWRERGVALRDGALHETVVSNPSLPSQLPAGAPEGYQLDLPLAAVDLAGRIAAQPWTGLFIAFDYGKSWRELVEATPAGTARAYHRHTQSNDLLARPGEQDLTCHVCWDWLAEALRENGFADVAVQTQESFLIRQAGDFMAATTAAEAGHFSQRKLGLVQLIHHLGQKFQVLTAKR